MKILLCDAGTPFDLNTPYNQPLGGSEIAILLLAKGLAELNNQVVLLTTANWSSERSNNLIVGPLAAFMDAAEQADVIVLNRFIPQEVQHFFGKKPIYYWSHDAYDQHNVQWMMNEGVWNSPLKLLCVSNWQANTFKKYLNVPEEKISILPNPIDASLYRHNHTKRNPYKMVYASIPYKGLEVLKKIFDDVCTRLSVRSDNPKDIKPELHVYSSMGLYGREDGDKEYEAIYNDLINTNGIFLHKPVSMRELATVFASSSILLAPCTYHETFGRVFIEAIAAGCVPMTVDNGANREILAGCVYINGANIKNLETHNHFVDKTCDILINGRGNIDSFKNYAMKFDYIKVANKFLRMLKE